MTLLWNYLKKYWRICVAVLALAAVNQIFSLFDPLIFRHVIDDYALKFDIYTPVEFFKGVGFLLALIVGTAFVSRVAKNFQDYFLNRVTQQVGADIYTTGVRHSLDLPYVVFEDQRSGETLGTLQKVRADIEKFLIGLINILFVSVLGFIFVTIYAVTVYWLIAVVYGLLVPIMIGTSYILTSKIKAIQKNIMSETAALAGSTTESLRNIELVKSLGLVDQEIDRLNSATDKILALELKKLRYLRSISFVQGTMVNFLRTALLFFLLYLMFVEIITFGEFFSLYFYSFFILNPLQELGGVISSFREAEVSLNKFKEIMGMPAEPMPAMAKTVGLVNELAFKDVSFTYQSANRQALSQINFSAKAGETIAFVGPSGSGKTSLVKLVVGLYRPDSGGISYNGVSADEVDLKKLRGQFGLVTQDTQLFAGTIKENLLFVRPDATDAECLEVLSKSAAQSLLERADKGLDTLIGEGGVKVSGGEKQRLAIARALLRHPNILIFDEATSALDSLTEEEITKTIREVTADKTRIAILIAHRLSTIMHADRIYVLEKGKVVETGSHSDLLAQSGLYAAMWRQQVGERA